MLKLLSLKSKSGSTLIWALIVVLVLSLVIAAGLNIVQRQQNSAVTQHIENQAYYTAMSTTKGLIDWLNGTEYSSSDGEAYSGDDPKKKLLYWIMAQPAGEWVELSVSAADGMALPDTIGTFGIFAKHDGTGNIHIKTTADYYGETRSIAGAITNSQSTTIIEGLQVDAKVSMPDTPAIPAESQLALLNSGNGTSGGNYYCDNRTAAWVAPGTVNTIVAEGNSSFTFTGYCESMVIKANAKVTLGNGAYIGCLVIEDGGQTEFLSSSKLYKLGALPYCEVFVMPGGSFVNTANGYNQANVLIYGYASNDPGKIARIQLGKMQVDGIVIQPVTEEFSGYSCAIDLFGGVSFVNSGVIHLPIGYRVDSAIYDLSNKETLPDAIRQYLCNMPGKPGHSPDIEPFCPHFLAINEPPSRITTDSWSSAGSFYED